MVTVFARFFPGLMRRAIRFLLPVDCAACGISLTNDPVPLFCTACWNTIKQSPHPRCARCDRPFASSVAMIYSPGHVCQTCAEQPPAFTRAWTLYPYLPPLQDAICLFKYRGRIPLAGPLSRLMIEVIPASLRIDLIIPVPLHPHRLREREFNQSLLLADRLGQHLQLPVASANLVRMTPSPPQTTLSRQDRLRNLRGAFAVRHPHHIDGKRILLIDDVFTTGATVNECAKTLRKAGSGDVFVLTLARTTDVSTVPDRILAQQTRRSVELLGG